MHEAILNFVIIDSAFELKKDASGVINTINKKLIFIFLLLKWLKAR